MFLPEGSSRKPDIRDWILHPFEFLRRKKPLDYVRFNSDGTRKIHLWWDDSSEVTRAGMFSVKPFFNEDRYDARIFEITRSGDKGDYRFAIYIFSVATDASEDIEHFASYDEDGKLYISGGSFVFPGEDPSSSRESKIKGGYILSSHLLPRINFGETVKRFLFNAISENPSFEPPELVPYDPALEANSKDSRGFTVEMPSELK